jgi:prolyl-tRNA synthetase
MYLDAQGASHPLLLCCSGLGLERLMATLVEQSHGSKGLCWPFSVAPYHINLPGLDLDKEEMRQSAEQLYADLCAAQASKCSMTNAPGRLVSNSTLPICSGCLFAWSSAHAHA